MKKKKKQKSFRDWCCHPLHAGQKKNKNKVTQPATRKVSSDEETQRHLSQTGFPVWKTLGYPWHTIFHIVYFRMLGKTGRKRKSCPTKLPNDFDLIYLDYYGMKQMITRIGHLMPHFKYVSINQSINVWINQSVNKLTHYSLYQSMSQSINQSISASISQ